jgi:hypothetical protein
MFEQWLMFWTRPQLGTYRWFIDDVELDAAYPLVSLRQAFVQIIGPRGAPAELTWDFDCPPT